MTIGFFDVSLESLALLKKTAQDFPEHDYISYIDTLNAPSYHTSENAELAAYVAKGIGYLIGKGCFVIVVGNTIPIAYVENDPYARESGVVFIAPDALEALLERENDPHSGTSGIRHIYLTKHSRKTDELIAELLQGSFLPH